MPYEERTVQAHGIVINAIQYYDDVLRPWIHATDPRDTTGRRKRKFIVRRDPRDLSRIYFYDPDLKQYFAIPYRHTAYPPMSIWELREVRRQLKAEGRKAVNAELLFDAYNRLRRLEAEAVSHTQKARREAQRRRHHTQGERPMPARVVSEVDHPLERPEDIRPFEEIEELDGGWGTLAYRRP